VASHRLLRPGAFPGPEGPGLHGFANYKSPEQFPGFCTYNDFY